MTELCSPSRPLAAADPPVVEHQLPAWVKCPGCKVLIYGKRLQRNLLVCPECGHHHRIEIRQRLAWLLDDGLLEQIGSDVRPVDFLGFVDRKPYANRLRELQNRSGSVDSVIAGHASIGGQPVIVAAFDFAFMGGSLGSVAGELITRAAETALELGLPLLLITASGGARMQEGCISLMQLAKTAQAIAELHENSLLCLNLNLDPTFGGATASFATLGDIILTEPGALTGFAGPRVIQQTIRQDLPAGFQTAQFQLQHGMADMVVPREQQRDTIAALLQAHSHFGALPPSGRSPVLTDQAKLSSRPTPELLKLARDTGRPVVLDYIAGIFDSFIELRGDRLSGEDSAILGGLARLGGQTVVVVGHRKGHTTKEMIASNFGMPVPAGFHKALRLYRHAAKFALPIVTFVDTPGAYPGTEAEERGQGHIIARCIMEMSALPVPVVSVVTGEGGSGGALALAVGNRVLMMQNAYYSVISPEGCSSILWGDASHAVQAAESLRVGAADLLELGIIDGVVPEPVEGAHSAPADAIASVGAAVLDCLHELRAFSGTELVRQRRARFRRMGVFSSTSG
jgi:acetyl-CoA carboxylase carboxyl transferase beta subunit/acetyl-CoA carboxylase carboxyl transferase alpha subunit